MCQDSLLEVLNQWCSFPAMRAKRGLRQGDPISPLQFVIVMEYLHRNLQQLKFMPDFNFHPKYERLHITNLCFAGDLLLFIRGDVGSVRLMMQKFKDFSTTTGLQASPTKFRIYFGGVEAHVRQLVMDATGFVEWIMPFKYLGVPLVTKKLTVNMPLIDKILYKGFDIGAPGYFLICREKSTY